MSARPPDALARAVECHRAGQLGPAAELYREAMRAAPGNAEIHTVLGTVLYQLGRPDEALELMRRAVAVDARYARGHCELGLMLCLRGLLDEASRALGRAIEIEPGLADAHGNLGDVLAAQSRFDEAAASYARALAIEPARAEIHNSLGAVRQAQGRLDEAIGCYRRALDIRPDFQAAAENLRAVMGTQVPAWHFTMLADEERNTAYQAAIESAVTEGAHVLDIGTGSGLLSMMAARAGAAHVTTCEMSAPLAAVAREIVAANGYADRITVVNKQSTLLQVGVDMPRRADVLVSEILDNKLLGEGVLPTVRHALENLVVPGGTVIPRSATILGALVEVPRLCTVNPVRDVCAFDLSPFDRFRDPNQVSAVYLGLESHRFLSDPFRALDFDFRAPPLATEGARPNRTRIEVPVTADGVAHAVAFWFELDVDDRTRVSTAPDGELRHWRQVVSFFETARPVRHGERLSIEARQSDDRIHFGL